VSVFVHLATHRGPQARSIASDTVVAAATVGVVYTNLSFALLCVDDAYGLGFASAAQDAAKARGITSQLVPYGSTAPRGKSEPNSELEASASPRPAAARSEVDAAPVDRHDAGMSSENAREACLVMAAAVAKKLGFETAEDAALEALADVVRYYVNCVARRASSNTRHAKRHDVALNDLLAALAQDPARPVGWRALRDFGAKWRAPAAARGACLPAAKRQRAAYYGALGRGDAPVAPRSVHVPKFLPPFPPAVEAARARRSAGARARPAPPAADDVREVEALQLALNRIEHAAAPGSSARAPIDVTEP